MTSPPPPRPVDSPRREGTSIACPRCRWLLWPVRANDDALCPVHGWFRLAPEEAAHLAKIEAQHTGAILHERAHEIDPQTEEST